MRQFDAKRIGCGRYLLGSEAVEALGSEVHGFRAKKALIVTAEADENVLRSASNIPGVAVSHVGAMNVYEILTHESFIVTKEACEKIQEVYK